MTITWTAIQNQYAASAAEHFDHAQALGLDCPADVFEQLFHDHHGDEDFLAVVRFINWANVGWEESALSGVALRRVAIPRSYQHAVDEARSLAMDTYSVPLIDAARGEARNAKRSATSLGLAGRPIGMPVVRKY
jgi:hypothetical protein